MTLTKKIQVVMLSTEHKTKMFIGKKYGVLHNTNNSSCDKDSRIYQELYFLSADEIKEGDYYFDGTNIRNDYNQNIIKGYDKKIIATTNISLSLKCDCGYIKKVNTGLCSGCGRFTNIPLLPQIPQGIVESYIESYNNNKEITEISVEYYNIMTAGNYSEIQLKRLIGCKYNKINEINLDETAKNEVVDLVIGNKYFKVSNDNINGLIKQECTLLEIDEEDNSLIIQVGRLTNCITRVDKNKVEEIK